VRIETRNLNSGKHNKRIIIERLLGKYHCTHNGNDSQFIVAQFSLDTVVGGPTVRVEKLQIVETKRTVSVIRLRRKLLSLAPQMEHVSGKLVR